MTTIITAGSRYVDIDVLASGIAYKQLLNLQRQESTLCLSGPFNATIPREMRLYGETEVYCKEPAIEDEDVFVIVDVSNPHYFSSFVNLNQVIAVFDHHFGFEKYWHARLHEMAKIEAVGACATLIWEAYVQAEQLDKMPQMTAKLLYLAIISNTLNFRAHVTHQRDRNAAVDLLARLPAEHDYVSEYYREIESSISNDLAMTIKSDTKEVLIQNPNLTFQFSQIELWDSEKFLKKHSAEKIRSLMSSMFPDKSWLLSLVSVKAGYNYLLSNSSTIIEKISKVIASKNNALVMQTERLWLRKEILRLIESPLHGNEKQNRV